MVGRPFGFQAQPRIAGATPAPGPVNNNDFRYIYDA